MSQVSIRPAEQADLPALREIYNHYIAHTPVTFDLEPKTLSERQRWFDGFGTSGRHRCFVAANDGLVIGWACTCKFRDKAAYQTTVETSVYLAPQETGRGIGRRLYETLFATLASEDIHRYVAGITQPNEASVALHRAMGFAPIGTFAEIGLKFGRFWDVAWYERPQLS